MRKFLLIAALSITAAGFAQTTRTGIKTYVASKNVINIKDTTVVIKDGYADYNITTPRSGAYQFVFNVLNQDGAAAGLSILNSAGAALAKSTVGINAKWQKITLNTAITAAGAVTKIRIATVSGITFGSFYYTPPAAPAPVPPPVVTPTAPAAKPANLDSFKNVIMSAVGAAIEARRFSLNTDSLKTAILGATAAAIESRVNLLPDLNLQGFEGKGDTTAPFINKPIELTEAQKNGLIGARPGMIIYQSDGAEGLYYRRKDGSWKFLN